MSSQKFKTNSYCVGGRHHSSTSNITGDITINEKQVKRLNYWSENVWFVIEKNNDCFW